MPARTSTDGCYRFDREFSRHGVGRIQLSSGTTKLGEFRARDALLTKLLNNGQLDILRALVKKELTVQQLVDADARNVDARLTLSTVKLKRPLWATATDVIDDMGCKATTKVRYKVSLGALKRKGQQQLPASATLADLASVDWKSLREDWATSPADWNHMRRAVSAILTAVLGDVYHPFRREVMNKKNFPKASEGHGRVPDISPERFWRAVDAMPDHVRPGPVVLALTAMRVGEYLAAGKEHLLPETLKVRVPGTKTDGSNDTVSVDERFWPWIEAGVPSPLGYKWLYKHWKRACKAVGMPDVTLHDLRHCHAQWASNEGLSDAKVQVSLRHASPTMTRRYSKQRDKGEVAHAIADVMERKAI